MYLTPTILSTHFEGINITGNYVNVMLDGDAKLHITYCQYIWFSLLHTICLLCAGSQCKLDLIGTLSIDSHTNPPAMTSRIALRNVLSNMHTIFSIDNSLHCSRLWFLFALLPLSLYWLTSTFCPVNRLQKSKTITPTLRIKLFCQGLDGPPEALVQIFIKPPDQH